MGSIAVLIAVAFFVALAVAIFVGIARWVFRVDHICMRLDQLAAAAGYADAQKELAKAHLWDPSAVFPHTATPQVEKSKDAPHS